MNRQTLARRVTAGILISLLLPACAGAPVSPSPSPPASVAANVVLPTGLPPTPALTPAASPPTLTPTPAFTVATSAEEVLGTWKAPSSYLRLDADGTFRQASALDDLEARPYAVSSYRFDGERMVVTEVSVSGVPTCGQKTGTYEVRILEGGAMWIVAIKEQCAPRASDIAGAYEPIR